jgi:hypothetical protein
MVLRNNTTGEYVHFDADDDERALALLDLREATHPTEPQWAQTGVEALENAKAKGILPSLVAVIPPTAVGADYTASLASDVESAGTVAGAVYIPNENITGVATNSRTVEVLDGATVVASIAFGAGVNGTIDEPVQMTNGTVAVAEGDALTAKSLHVGTGLADPGGIVVVTFSGNVAESTHDFSESDADAKDE